MMKHFFRAHFFGFHVLMLGLGSLALASATVGLAQEQQAQQEQNSGPSAGGQTPTAPANGAIPSAFDPTARIKYLHDRLRITPEQEPLWDTVAQAIRDNVRDIAPLLKERFRTKTSGSAPDVLHAYEALGEVQLASLNRFIAVFDPLYAGLSENQKKIADVLLRQGPLTTMIGDLPEIPAPFGLPLPYAVSVPYYGPAVGGLGVPLFVHRPGHFQRFQHFQHFQPAQGVVSPGRPAVVGGRFGGFHR